MSESKNQLISYFENMGLIISGILLLIFPLLFLSITTDAFILPKQIALAIVTGLLLLFFVAKTVVDGKISLRSTPFDLPILLFVLILFLSAIFSSNRYDALIGFVPYLYLAFFYFAIVNTVKQKKHLSFIITSLVLGSVVAGLLSILSFFKIYALPFAYTHTQQFTTFGSLLDQAVYLGLILLLLGQILYGKFVTKKHKVEEVSPFDAPLENRKSANVSLSSFYIVSFVIILASFIINIYSLSTTQKPLILPFSTGLQTAFGAVSQDNSNILKGLLLGSGTGTYLVDFTRFKTAAYNANANLWAFTFFRSSSYVLELIATTGLLGIAAFFFLVFKVFKQKLLFVPLLVAIVTTFVLPFSFVSVFLLFVLLAIFAVKRILSKNKEKVSEVEFYFVSLKRKLFGEEKENSQRRHGKILAIVICLILAVIIGIPLYFSTIFVASDITFQKALVAASQNQGTQTYDLEVKAIQTFPYRDIYYRAFSQVNITLASILVQQQQGKQPDEQTQQNILTLIQQSINAGRNATTVAPLTAFNWNNLSSIYRSLIGFGQNADQFALVTAKQATLLDPNNPQQYIEYGGIFYQLGNYDEAIRQFQFAVTIKQDYANAYYNLGHALEIKGNLNEAMQAYQIVKSLVVNDKVNAEKIDSDIKALQDKIGKQPESATNVSASGQQQPLNVNQPTTQLPERKPPVEIPGPKVSPTPTETAPTPTGAKTTPTISPTP